MSEFDKKKQSVVNIINRVINHTRLFPDANVTKKSLHFAQNNDFDEEILLPEFRDAIYPINPKYTDIRECYDKQMNAMWFASHINLDKDREDFVKLNKETQDFIKNILGFFATADNSIIVTIDETFKNEIKNLEIKMCYDFQAMMEGIHADVYGRLLMEIVQDESEKIRLLNAIKTFPCIREKNAWSRKWAFSNAPFVQRLVSNAIVEGIFFSGSFCAIFWLKKQNKMPGLIESNEYISRDEWMHCELACKIYATKIKHKMKDEMLKEMVNDAVTIEKNFINESLKCDLIGMNPRLMSQYIEYVADILLLNLGHTKLYNSTNPFPFMQTDFNLQVKSNFFETKTTTYQRLGKQQIEQEDPEDF